MRKNIKQVIHIVSLGCSLFFLTGISPPTSAATVQAGYTLSANQTQLAWYSGYGEWRPRYRSGYYMYVPGPRYRNRGVYWTGWYRIAPRCQKRCLISAWGETIRCVRRCW
jgi:hypothetical protein